MRLKNAFRNSFFSVISQIILIIVGFFSQRVMNLSMGEELVGLNGVISNVIAILSVSELGLATAVVFHLYSALANGNEEEIAGLMNIYRKAYTIIAMVILLLGGVTLPFFHLFLKNSIFSIAYVRMIYGLWILRTVCSYLLSYKRSILIADQKEYIVSIVTLMINAANYIVCIVILQFFKRYEWVLLINIGIEFALNLWVSNYVNKKYPYLVKYGKKPLNKDLVKKIFNDIKNIFVTRVSSKILTCTDNLIISSFISVAVVGLYSNYCLITQSIVNITLAFMNAIQPSIGNLFIEKDNKKNSEVLREVTFITFLWGTFAIASIMALISPFVTDWWLGKNYELSFNVVVFCSVNCFFYILTFPLMIVMGVTGLFDKERNLSVFAALANLVVSLSLVKPLGVIGVLLGTFVSYVIQIVYRMVIFFRVYLEMEYKKYAIDLAQYIILAFGEVALTYYVTRLVYVPNSILSFLGMMLICLIIPNVLNLLMYFRSNRFKGLLGMAKSLIKPKTT